MSEREREIKELKRVLARELQSLQAWAEGHLAVKDVKFDIVESSDEEGDEKPLNIETVKNPLGSKIKKALSEYRSLLKRIALANA